MKFENVDLGYNEETEQWKVHPCCHTCGEPSEIICFDYESDYDEYKDQDFPCSEHWWVQEIEGVKNGTSDFGDMIFDSVFEDEYEQEGGRKAVQNRLLEENPKKYTDESCYHGNKGMCTISRMTEVKECQKKPEDCNSHLPKHLDKLREDAHDLIADKGRERISNLSNDEIREKIEGELEHCDYDAPFSACKT